MPYRPRYNTNRHVPPAAAGPPVLSGPLSLKVSAGYGRLYVGGPHFKIAYQLPGAVINDRRGVVELSLTLETLRALRKLTNLSPEQFARFCTPDVLNWARAAGQSERVVAALHDELAHGWRMRFPWTDVEYERGLVPNYRPPFDHQQVMATAACVLDGVAILGEMGTGKTRAAAEAIRYKLDTGLLDIVVVVCPRGVIGTWRRQLARWTEGLNAVSLIGLTVKERIRLVEQAVAGTKTVFVVNYDVMDKMREAFEKLSKRMKMGLVLDEAHRIRNPNTKTAKATLALAGMLGLRIIMTGTPILQGGQDIWSQWYVVDLGVAFGANYVQFRREFFDDDPYTFEVVPKPGALDEIGARMRRRGLRYRKEDCLDLPPKMYERIEVDLTAEQAKAYAEMQTQLVTLLTAGRPADLLALLGDEEDVPRGTQYATAANQLAVILRLSQITSGFVRTADGGIHRFVPNPKLDALEELVREQIAEQQIIVWARYREDHDRIMERLAEFNPQLIRGGVSQAKRDDIEVGFQEGRYRLMVGQPGAGGVGLDLWRASLACYYSQDYSLEKRAQSEDRCHRAGSEMHEKVTYVDFIAKNTTDVVVSDALEYKQSVADVVVDLKKILGINA